MSSILSDKLCRLNLTATVPVQPETPVDLVDEPVPAAAELTDSPVEWLRQNLGPHLKKVQEPIDEWLGTLPMEVAMFCAIGLFVVAVVWVWTLRRDFIFRGAPDRAPWRDLRVWATLVVVPYVLVYLWLGR